MGIKDESCKAYLRIFINKKVEEVYLFKTVWINWQEYRLGDGSEF